MKLNYHTASKGLANVVFGTQAVSLIFNGEDMVVCDKGIKWMSILPQNDFYCITAMMNEKEEILVWYVDMIESQGTDSDDIPYFIDLYLDLVVYPDGTIMVDDMDELEEA